MRRKKAALLPAAVLMIGLIGCTAAIGTSPLPQGQPETSESTLSDPPSKPTGAESPPAQTTDPGPQESSPPETPAQWPVTLYLPNDNADGFVPREAQTDGTAQHIVSLLVREGALPEDCALTGLTLDGQGGAVANMNAAFGAAIGHTGTAGEYLRIGCVVNTLLVYFDLNEITLTVDEKTLETGHNIYDTPLRFYENQTAQ